MHFVCFFINLARNFFLARNGQTPAETIAGAFYFSTAVIKPSHPSIQWAGGGGEKYVAGERPRPPSTDGVREVPGSAGDGDRSPNEEVGDYACKRNPNVSFFFFF